MCWRGLYARAGDQERVDKKTPRARAFSPMCCHGAARIILTAPRSYEAVALHRGACEKRLRDGKLATNSHGKPASGPRLPIHPPRRHPGLERGLEGRDQLLKLVEGHTGEIQELHRAGLQLGEPYTSHGSYLLLLYRDVRGASYH